jgi:hypothetical protein
MANSNRIPFLVVFDDRVLDQLQARIDKGVYKGQGEAQLALTTWAREKGYIPPRSYYDNSYYTIGALRIERKYVNTGWNKRADTVFFKLVPKKKITAKKDA